MSGMDRRSFFKVVARLCCVDWANLIEQIQCPALMLLRGCRSTILSKLTLTALRKAVYKIRCCKPTCMHEEAFFRLERDN